MNEGISEVAVKPEQSKPSELDRRKQGISRYVNEWVLGKNKGTDVDLKDSFKDFSPREKAEILRDKLRAYYATDVLIRREKYSIKEENGIKKRIENPDYKGEPVSPYLISEIKALWEDQKAQELFVESYAGEKFDRKIRESSELWQKWQDTNETISDTREAYEAEARQLFLKKLRRPDQISDAQGRSGQFARELIDLKREKDLITHLEGLPHSPENTDIAAFIMFDTLLRYRKQLDKGFVWLPSREDIHNQIIASLQNGRWPVLRGEAGTGKSEQADAAILALTDEQPTYIKCGSNTGEHDLIGGDAVDHVTGGSYKEYGPPVRAATGYIGYEDLRKINPEYNTGRGVRFDESGRLGNKGYSVIKELRQKRFATPEDIEKWKNRQSLLEELKKRPATPEDNEKLKKYAVEAAKLLEGKPVLPGFCAVFTTNPEGVRYPDRSEPDPALRRELSYITVDYPEMTVEDPELYEFMLSTLMDHNKHIHVAKNELSPAYEKVHMKGVLKGMRLDDGREIISEEKLIADPTDKEHGALYRLAFALRSLQDAFNYGNMTDIPDTALRYNTNAAGKIEIVPLGGDPLTLSSSTITLGEIKSWMKGFNERRLKDDPSYQVDTLTQFIQMKLKGYVTQADDADKEKIQTIFEHFHLFNAPPDIKDEEIISKKEIGYLSPRVPRPVDLAPLGGATYKEQTAVPEQKMYEDIQCVRENGSSTKALLKPLEFEKDGKKVHLKNGRRFLIGTDKFRFVGLTEDGDSAVVMIDTGHKDEALHKILDIKELREKGEFKNQIEDAKELYGEDFLGPEAVKGTWGVELSDDEIPDIQFSEEELKRAKELGQFLILRIDKAPDGQPLTMEKMQELLQPKFDKDIKGKIFFDTSPYKDEGFFTKDKPRAKWALVSKEVIPGSISKNHLEQTQLLADYLQQEVFKDSVLPPGYQEAIEEFDKQKAAIANMLISDWQEAAKKLSELKLNQLARQTPVEAIYDILAYFKTNNKRLLEKKYNWTSRRTSSGNLVSLGSADSSGANVYGWNPDNSTSNRGIALSR